MSLETKHFYEFKNFRLDPAERVLLRDGKPLPLPPKAFHLLKILVENHGHIVDKDKLIDEIWADSFVEDGNLAVGATMLRKALDDDANDPTFIETIPRRGYRFIAEVTEKFEDATAAAQLNGNDPMLPDRVSNRGYLVLGALLILVIGSAAVTAWYTNIRFSSSELSAPILSAPFKSHKFATSGKVSHAAISPDGKFAAYTDEVGDKQNIWLTQLATSENIEIIPPSDDMYYGLAFSHDGNSLYFVRKPRAGHDPAVLYRVMTFGGIPVKVIDNVEGWISLSPDDRQISFLRCRDMDDEFCSLLVADANGSNERNVLTLPKPIRISGNKFSPNGRSIAFAAGQSRSGSNEFGVSQVDIDSGAVREITGKKFFNVKSLEWLPKGNGLLFVAKENLAGKFAIWHVDANTGETKQLTDDSTDYGQISVDQNAAKIVATQISDDFRLYLSSTGNPTNSRTLTPARDVAFAPDGKIVYGGTYYDIWIMDPDGNNQRQLTNSPFADFSPRVSPDGRYIYFTSNRTGANQVWRMKADGTNQIQLTKSEGGYPSAVSPDGKWIYFQSGLHQALWRVSADGGEETQVSATYDNSVSPDGTLTAYFFHDKGLKIGIMRTADRRVVRVLDYGDGKSMPQRLAWSPDSKTINFIVKGDGKNTLWQQSLDEKKSRMIADLGGEDIRDLAMMPDGKGFAFIRGKWINDAVLITGLK